MYHEIYCIFIQLHISQFPFKMALQRINNYEYCTQELLEKINRFYLLIWTNLAILLSILFCIICSINIIVIGNTVRIFN